MIRQLRPATEPMRVLLLTNSVAMGGMEEHVRLLAADLDRSAFCVVGVAPDDPAVADFADALRRNCDHFAAVTPDVRFGRLQGMINAARLSRYVRERQIEVAHLHSTTFGGLWVATLVCWASGVRRVYVTEHLAPYGPVSIFRRAERRLYGLFATKMIAVSEKNRLERAARLHTPPDRTAVITNGVDMSRFDQIASDQVEAVRDEFRLEECVVIGTAVRLEPGKGIHDLVDAFAVVAASHPEARLLLVGDGSLRAELESQVDALGVRAQTVFTGFRSDPRPFLAAMDVFVLPVPAGSASIALLEAMAIGLPAIITFGGPGEAVEPGKSGWWAKPNDPTDLAARIGDLIDRPIERAAMGNAARDRIATDFSGDRVARQLGQLYLTNA